MAEEDISWQQDGTDTGWFFAENVGSVRKCRLGEKQFQLSPWRLGFLPEWLPDTEEHDVGPFKTKAAALAEAERLKSLQLHTENH
ncbi:hypothetical protein [Rhizobium ruizarguesonis]|uniref:hypothetical protein n=1 Tax=Rhizobium ruizarguesonis TaxID=2081791 RepID=UPI0010301D1F|nr:hypothetical protein [Rhizobium ruizarguesonis]TAY79714.1 hypothetical protein ELH86_12520 [Rhizobium ruizarguesonis]TBD21825.1 hypothetical protein ELH23_13505 [Rhizobium ruizarguesonis]